MAVEILRKKDDGTMEKLDIGGEVDLDGYAKLDSSNTFTGAEQIVKNSDSGVNQGWIVNNNGYYAGVVGGASSYNVGVAYKTEGGSYAWLIYYDASNKVVKITQNTYGSATKGIYLSSGAIKETDEFLTASTIAKMTTDDVDALFA